MELDMTCMNIFFVTFFWNYWEKHIKNVRYTNIGIKPRRVLLESVGPTDWMLLLLPSVNELVSMNISTEWLRTTNAGFKTVIGTFSLKTQNLTRITVVILASEPGSVFLNQSIADLLKTYSAPYRIPNIIFLFRTWTNPQYHSISV
jgi:hypothetical protein